MKKTNFDRYLEEQLQDPVFAARFKRAGEAWDVALQISRLESPDYEGHSLATLRRVVPRQTQQN